MQASAAPGTSMVAPPTVERLADPGDPRATILRSSLSPAPLAPSLFHLVQPSTPEASLAERAGRAAVRRHQPRSAAPTDAPILSSPEN